MSKHNRVREQEWIRRNRQRNQARFEHWYKRTNQWDAQAALIQYRLFGRKRCRSDKSQECRRAWA